MTAPKTHRPLRHIGNPRFGNHGACLEARAVLWSISIDNFRRLANEPGRA